MRVIRIAPVKFASDGNIRSWKISNPTPVNERIVPTSLFLPGRLHPTSTYRSTQTKPKLGYVCIVSSFFFLIGLPGFCLNCMMEFFCMFLWQISSYFPL
uniref:Uncharacterized protein n=1 Tax=Picea sitchensis TaxID=3332 RepID=A9P017_PICSI|nr:unknown [Picea sitchensis]